MKSIVFLLLSLIFLTCKPETSPAAQEANSIGQDAAVAEIKKLGGTVEIDENSPGKPVVSVAFPPTRVTDAGLAQLQGLTNLQELSLGTQIDPRGRQRVKLKFGESGDVISIRISGAIGSEAANLRRLTKLQTLALFGNFPESQLFHLKKLSSLRTLHLNDAQISDAGLEQLSELTSLQKLVLPSSRVTDSGLAHLRKLTNLQLLHLGGDQISAAGKKQFEAALPNCKMIVSLRSTIAETQSQDEAKRSSGSARPSRKLEPRIFTNPPAATEHTKNQSALGLDGNNSYVATEVRYDGTHSITVEAWVRPEDLSGHREVICNAQASGIVLGFYDGWCKFLVHNGQGYQQAVANGPIRAGQEVHLAGVFDGQRVTLFINGMKQRVENPFQGSHKPSSLPFLIAANPEPNLFPIKQFAGVIDEVRFSTKARYDTDFEPQRRLAADEYTAALYHFDAGSRSVARDSSGNRSDARIDDAWFVENNTTDATSRLAPGAVPPSARPGLPETEVPFREWMEYATPKIGNDEMQHLKGLTNLQTLLFTTSLVTDAGLVHLKDMTNLRGLQLNGSNFTDAGLRSLEKLTNLTSLDLRNTQVTDAGLAHLQPLTNLDELTLSATQVTDGGLHHLIGLSQLRRLQLQNTRVTRSGIQKLQFALPKCEILHSAR